MKIVETMKDIFVKESQFKEIKLTLFADERKNINNQWDYIILLIVPSDKISDALKLLDEGRAVEKRLRGKIEKVKYPGELKFSDISKALSGEKYQVAKNWIEEIIKDGKKRRDIFYFSILGIDKTKIDPSKFGGDKSLGEIYATYYNRFFRTNFLSSIKAFFGNFDKIIIDAVFHDKEGNLELHEYFPWHLIFRVEKDEAKIQFITDEITFVNSNHTKENYYPWASHFVQLADILIGAISHCLDFTNPKHRGQRELAKFILPLVYRLVEKPGNKNSSFGYFNKYQISFFPKTSYGGFYSLRKIKLLEMESGQLELF